MVASPAGVCQARVLTACSPSPASGPPAARQVQAMVRWLWSPGRRLLARRGREHSVPLQILPEDPWWQVAGQPPPPAPVALFLP